MLRICVWFISLVYTVADHDHTAKNWNAGFYLFKLLLLAHLLCSYHVPSGCLLFDYFCLDGIHLISLSDYSLATSTKTGLEQSAYSGQMGHFLWVMWVTNSNEG